MTLSTETIQLISAQKLLTPVTRKGAIKPQPRKVTAAITAVINTLKTTNGFRATLLAAFVGFPLLAGFGDAHALSLKAHDCKAHVLLLKNGAITMQGLPIVVTQNHAPIYNTISHSVYIPLKCGQTYEIAVKNGTNILTRTVWMQGDQKAHFELGE